MKGKLLVSHPTLQDPAFRKTVVFIISHDDKKGTIGLVVNRAGPISLKEVWIDAFDKKIDNNGFIHSGGPVLCPITALHCREDLSDGCHKVVDGIWLVSNGLNNLIELDCMDSRFYLGYARWKPNQLQKELDSGAWYLSESSKDSVFYNYKEDLHKDLMEEIGRSIMQEMTHIKDEFVENANNN